MNLSETNFSRTAESQWLWQGAICHIWTSQLDKHWRHLQKQLQKYNVRDIDNLRQEVLAIPRFSKMCLSPSVLSDLAVSR